MSEPQFSTKELADRGSLLFAFKHMQYIESALEWKRVVTGREEHTLLIALEGSGRLSSEDDQQTISKSTCVAVEPGKKFMIKSDQQDVLKGYFLTFHLFRLDTDIPASLQQERGCPFAGEVQLSQFPDIARMVSQLAELDSEVGELSRHKRQMLFQNLIHRIWEQKVQRPVKTDSRAGIGRTVAYMEHAYYEDVTREKLAALAGMSPAHYSTAFRKEVGKTPLDYLTEVRVSRAKEMLLSSDERLHDIAKQVGYSSEYYFSNRFKQITGYPPSEYAHRNRAKKMISSRSYTAYYRGSVGEEVVPEQVIGLFIEDYLAALGVKPLLQYACGPYYQKYLELHLNEVQKLDVMEIDFDAVWRSKPELILLAFPDFATKGSYEQFAQIAPTYVFEHAAEDWRETFRTVAELVGRKPRAEEFLRHYEENAAYCREVLKQAIGNQTVALLRLHASGELRLYGGPHGYSGTVLYHDLGLTLPSLVRQWSWGHTGGVRAIALERLRDLDADHLFLVIDDGVEKEEELLLSSEVWKELAAVKHGRIYEVSTDVWMTFGALANERKIADVMNALLTS
ncbi:hypothetical protein GCM10008018_07470 [Paenibacillus marchantiophytorum]|uniref:Helix-turn-helix domain-containing protein n=1 Tax=Paenibacillus marchantiophytorum TaxID=1619310 RepID=A0ABQ2BSA2_9BACL|nr:AraC family transcriptional regulator [Paenibacillus marchantiophytorum]GGI44511.1 hypothetical protein GCM10008018_07470 [Paenibacillus marchantiophytorum]